MKGIKICGGCANYDWKKHKCKICEDEGKPTDPFYADCPLPDVEEFKVGFWKESDFIHGMLTCSECGAQRNPKFKIGGGLWNYCPNCGSMMLNRREKK